MTARFHVVLIEPEIPHNTGAVARLCLAVGARLHLVGRLGFHLDDRYVRRAGLDYWKHVDLHRHDDYPSFREQQTGSVNLYSTHAKGDFWQAPLDLPVTFVFGGESRGLSDEVKGMGDPCFRIPIYDERVRSLNLSTSVGIVLYDAIRRLGPVSGAVS